MSSNFWRHLKSAGKSLTERNDRKTRINVKKDKTGYHIFNKYPCISTFYYDRQFVLFRSVKGFLLTCSGLETACFLKRWQRKHLTGQHVLCNQSLFPPIKVRYVLINHNHSSALCKSYFVFHTTLKIEFAVLLSILLAVTRVRTKMLTAHSKESESASHLCVFLVVIAMWHTCVTLPLSEFHYNYSYLPNITVIQQRINLFQKSDS